MPTGDFRVLERLYSSSGLLIFTLEIILILADSGRVSQVDLSRPADAPLLPQLSDGHLIVEWLAMEGGLRATSPGETWSQGFRAMPHHWIISML